MATIARMLTPKPRADRSTADDGEFAAQLAGALATSGVDGSFAWYHRFFQDHCGADLRRQRGVYCTPQELAGYIVCSVDYLLSERLGFSDGLAGERSTDGQERLRIVDPACGSGVFLSELVARLRDRFRGREAAPLWREFVARRLPHLIAGFDVLPAAIEAAGALLQHQLAALDLPPEERNDWAASAAGPPLPLYAANSLANGASMERLVLGAPRQRPALVVMGNPPYANFGRANRAPWILQQLEDYKHGLGEKKLNLNDDFIKFFRWGQYWIDCAGSGVLALVTSNTYLAGITHRRMRESLLRSFDEIYILDLHGDHARRKHNYVDENVFDIRQGVAIGMFVKTGGSHCAGQPAARVYHADLRGSRKDKLAALSAMHVGSTTWRRLSPRATSYYFSPQRRAPGEYDKFLRLTDVFEHYISGVQTKNDALYVGLTREEVADRMRVELAARNPRRDAAIQFDDSCLRHYTVAPFDRRWIYYEPRLLGRARFSVMRHMLQENIALAFMRQSTTAGEYDHFLVVDSPASDRCFYSPHGAPYLAPLFLYDDGVRRPNLQGGFLGEVAARLGAKRADAQGVFHYLVAVFHSFSFRQHYGNQLRTDFPRIPLTTDVRLFRRLSLLGAEMAALQTRQGQATSCAEGAIQGAGDNAVVRGFPRFVPLAGGAKGRLYINSRQFLPGISQQDWQMRIGGYEVLSRWLKRRRGREMTTRDVAQLHHVTTILRRMRRLMRRIDQTIPRWPLP